jgi:4-amino-4-deoxy-L-arabinose transferase-like glycosyltransferase
MRLANEIDRPSTLDCTPPGANRKGCAILPAVWIPEHSRMEQAIALCLFSLGFLYLCLFRRYTSIDPDEGIILQGAQRILNGEILYRDFFSFFTPGSYYLNALVMRLFGDSFGTVRTAVAFIGAAFCPVTYFLARRVCSRGISTLVAVLMALTSVPVRFLVLHNWDSTLLACLAVYSAVRWAESRNASWFFCIGSFTSLTFLFEQSKGVGLSFGLCVGIMAVAFRDKARILITYRHLTALGIGFGWPLVIVIIYFASQRAVSAMVVDWFWPIQHYSTVNRVPFGNLNLSPEGHDAFFHGPSLMIKIIRVLTISSAFWIPILPLFSLALLPRLWLAIEGEGGFGQHWCYYVLVSSSVTGLFLFAVLAVRPDRLHFVYLQPILFVILAWLLDGLNLRGPAIRRLGSVLTLCAVASLSPLAVALFVSATEQHYTFTTSRGTVALPAPDIVLRSIQSQVEPGERILVYPYAPLYYFLTRTYASTRFEYLQPGMNTKPQQREMLQELSANPVRAVVYESTFADHIATAWPNTPASALAADPVADYIQREYRLCSSIQSSRDWHFLFMLRKDLACSEIDRSAR